MKYQEQFNNPQLVFENGVAAIDVITLNGAGVAVEPYMENQLMVLPVPANYEQTASFEDLMQISIDRSNPKKISVTAIIDTKKMTWDELHNPQKTTFTDYTGTDRQAVSFSGLQVSFVDGILVTNAPLKLYDGRPALMWFAEMPLDSLQQSSYYELFNRAKSLTSGFDKNLAEHYDQVKIPAQQIDYVRRMGEILQLNPELEDVIQKFKIGLDDTGARVYVETSMRLGRSMPQQMPEPKIAIFGSNNPVIFWLTEPEASRASTPFAIVATTSEAWLNLNQEVSFEFAGVNNV